MVPVAIALGAAIWLFAWRVLPEPKPDEVSPQPVEPPPASA